MRSEPEQQQGGIPISETVLLKGRCLKRRHPADTTLNPHQLYSLELTSDLPQDSLRRDGEVLMDSVTTLLVLFVCCVLSAGKTERETDRRIIAVPTVTGT